MNTWSTLTWTVARAGGFMSFALLTAAVALGLALSLRWQRPQWPRLITNELHNFVVLLSLLFGAIHGLAVWLDPYLGLTLSQVLVPGLSPYRPLFVGLGIVSAYVALAVWATTQIRPLIGWSWWKRFHAFAYLAYVLALVHGLGTGSDTKTLWGMAIYVGSALLVGGLLIRRLLTPIGKTGRTYPNIAALSLLLFAGIGIWSLVGPLRPGWNAIAGGGQTGKKTGVAIASPSAAGFSLPLSANLTGTMTEQGPDMNGAVTLQVNAPLSGRQGNLVADLQGMPVGNGMIQVTNVALTLTPSSGQPAYEGTTGSFSGAGGAWQIAAELTPVAGTAPPLHVNIMLEPTSGTAVSGQIQASSAASAIPQVQGAGPRWRHEHSGNSGSTGGGDQ
jgi:hypothetical protein